MKGEHRPQEKDPHQLWFCQGLLPPGLRWGPHRVREGLLAAGLWGLLRLRQTDTLSHKFLTNSSATEQYQSMFILNNCSHLKLHLFWKIALNAWNISLHVFYYCSKTITQHRNTWETTHTQSLNLVRIFVRLWHHLVKRICQWGLHDSGLDLCLGGGWGVERWGSFHRRVRERKRVIGMECISRLSVFVETSTVL